MGTVATRVETSTARIENKISKIETKLSGIVWLLGMSLAGVIASVGAVTSVSPHEIQLTISKRIYHRAVGTLPKR